MPLNPPFQGMKNGPQTQIIFEVLEGCFHLRELNVKLPELFRLLRAQIAAQQITAFAAPHLAQLVFAQLKSETGRPHRLSFFRQRYKLFFSAQPKSSSNKSAIALS